MVLGTLVLAAMAVLQQTILGWLYHPRFHVSSKTEPPDCVAVPFTDRDGTFVADSVYLRLWVKNIGNATAENVEVYAKELRLQRADGERERVGAFPPMNLKWAHFGTTYCPNIVPDMGKHCENGVIAAAGSAGVGASMRPRRIAAENRRVERERLTVLPASMRPRRIAAENEGREAVGLLRRLASMRPRRIAAENGTKELPYVSLIGYVVKDSRKSAPVRIAAAHVVDPV